MPVLNGASQLALHRFAVQIDQYRQAIDLLQRLDVFFLLKRNLKEADGALAITAAKSETTEDITEQIMLHFSRCLVLAEPQCRVKKRLSILL